MLGGLKNLMVDMTDHVNDFNLKMQEIQQILKGNFFNFMTLKSLKLSN